MKISIIFDTVQEGLAAISVLTGAGASVTVEEPEEPATPGAVHPVYGVELDSKGFPWVAEAHAGTKGKNKDGSWKSKKGVDDVTRAAIEQAALAKLQATSSTITVPAAEVVAAPVVAALPTGIIAAALPPVSYDKLVEKYTQLAAANLIDATKIGAIYAACGVMNPADLTTNETMCAKVYAELVKLEAPVGMPIGMPGM